MNKPWHELYSDFSMFLLGLIKPIVEESWNDIRCVNPDINSSIAYWTEKPDYSQQYRNEHFIQYLNTIKTFTGKKQFLSGINILFLLITEEKDTKTVRLCFPTDINKFKETYFPYSDNLNTLQYPIAQFALADMSWETLIGKEIQRSLTGEIISSGKARYIKDVREYREKSGKEESIRPDVDDDIGFLSLVYIPMVKDEIYVLLHSPVNYWFSDKCKYILSQKINNKLKAHKEGLGLIHSFMEHWEKEAKRTAISVYKDLLDMLLHSNAFQEHPEAIQEILGNGLWEKESLGSLLSNMPSSKPFRLKETIRTILSDIPQLRINMERHLGLDLSFLESNTDYTVLGVQEILKEVLWELIVNAKKYSQTAEMVIDKVPYGWKDDSEILGASISLTTKGVTLNLDQYMTLRFGIPHRSFDNKDTGFGMWLINHLISSGGGILRVSLNRNFDGKNKSINKYRECIDFTIIFPLAVERKQ